VSSCLSFVRVCAKVSEDARAGRGARGRALPQEATQRVQAGAVEATAERALDGATDTRQTQRLPLPLTAQSGEQTLRLVDPGIDPVQGIDTRIATVTTGYRGRGMGIETRPRTRKDEQVTPIAITIDRTSRSSHSDLPPDTTHDTIRRS